MIIATRVTTAAAWITALGLSLTPIAASAAKPRDFGTSGDPHATTARASLAASQSTNTAIVNTPVCIAPLDQMPPVAIPDGSGGVIAAWSDYRSGDIDIFAQKMNAGGAPAWPEDGVPICKFAGTQSNPKLLSDGAGGAFIVWEDARNGATNVDIYAQRVNSLGVPQWTAGGVLVCGAPNNQTQPVIGPNGLGGLLISWVDQRGVDADIYGQRLNAAGAPQWTANGVALCSATGIQADPTVVTDGAGGSIVAWRDERSGVHIYAQRVNELGTVQWAANGVALSLAAGTQEGPRAVSDGAGGAIVAWQDTRSGSGYDVYAQRVSGAGTTQWTLDGVAVSTAANDQKSPRLCSDGANGAVIVWEDRRGADSDVYAQLLNGAGVPQWTANGVGLCTAPDQQVTPAIATDPLGGAVVTWSDSRSGNSDIYVQHVQPNGTSLWTANGVLVCNDPSLQDSPVAVADGAGGAAVAWRDFRGTYADIYNQRVDAGGQVPNQCVPADSLIQSTPTTIVAAQNYKTIDQCYGGALCDFYWAGVGVRSDGGGDWDLEAYDAGSEGLAPYPTCFGMPLAGSYQTYPTDFIMYNFNENHTPPTQIYPVRAYRYSGSGTAKLEWDGGQEQLEFYNLDPVHNFYSKPASWSDVLDVIDTQLLTAGTTYTFQITHDPAADIHLLLFSSFNSPGFYYVVPRSSRVMETTGWGTFTSPNTEHYGLAIVNDNGGPGGYTLKMWSVPVTTGVDGPPSALTIPTGITAINPNPGRGPVTVDFAMREAGKASFRIFDMAGRTVGTIGSQRWEPGRWTVRWDGRDSSGRPLSAGLYFVQMNVDDRRVGIGRVTLLH